MIQILERIPFSQILSWALTIFSTVFAIYTWIVGKKRKELSVSCKTNEIIIAGKYNIDKLKIQYAGQSIEDLSSSIFYVWNSGNTVINNSDIVNSRPIRIKNTGNATILDAQIIRVSEEANAWTIKEKTDEHIVLSFDYLDQGEGFVLQVLHDGSALDLELDCKIKGGMGIRERSAVRRKTKESRVDYFVDVFFAALPSLLGFFIMLPAANLCTLINNTKDIPLWLGNLLVMICVVGGLFIGILLGIKIAKITNKKFHRNIPIALRIES